MYCSNFPKDKIFANAVKVAISAMQLLTQKKKSVDKIFANESKWQNFLLAKFPAVLYVFLHVPHLAVSMIIHITY